MLVGRDSELAAVTGVLERASGLVLVRGEPGIGKTAFLDEAARRADGFLVLRAAGFESEAELAYAALHQLLTPLTPRIGTLPGPQAGSLRAALGLEGGEGVDRLLVGLAVLTLLASASEEEPVLCLLDDVQWIDRESRDALAFAARRLDVERVAMIWATREGAGVRADVPGALELPLKPLERGEASRLLRARHGEALGSERETILELAAGNPLALVELAGAAAKGSTGATTVEQSYADSIRKLPEETRSVLLVAAADEAARVGTVAEVASSLGTRIAALEPAERAGLVRVERDELVFRHPLVRAVVYRSATFEERRRIHEALAAAFQGPDDADRLAWHRAAATVGVDEEVASLLEDTATRAIARSGYGAAASALERAGALSPAPADRARRLVLGAECAALAGQSERALDLLGRVEGPIEDVSVQVQAARVRGVVQSREGALAEAVQTFLAAAEAAYPADRTRALELVTLAQEAAGLAGDRAIYGLAEWAERLGEPESVDEEIMLGLVRGFAAVAGGDRSGATPHLARAAAKGDDVEEPRLLVWAATAAMYLGEDARVHRLLRRTIDVACARGAVGAMPFALHLLAGVERRLGDLAGAEADAGESLRLALETGQPVVAAGALSTLTALAAFRGDVERAEQLAAETRAIAQPRRLPVALGGVARALAELELARGRAAEALEIIESAVGPPDDPRRNHPYALYTTPLLVEAAVRAGVPDRVGPSFDSFEQWADGGGLGWAAALAARCRALFARDAGSAEEWFDRALALHEASPYAFERARTQLLYGELLRRARRRRDARVLLREALEAFESLGARLWTERALGELRATGATARRRDESTRDELTAQELQVVRLVALGKTNPEVAAQLFVSPKTVQYHLRKVFTKLGVASRNELTRLVVQGDVPGAVAS